MPQLPENAAEALDAASDEPLQYFVSSCLTVTCTFADGSRVGGHFSLAEGGTLGDSVTAWATFLSLVNGRNAVTTQVIGQVDWWNPGYLSTTPWYQSGQDNVVPGDLTALITGGTGAAPAFTTQTGDITILADGTVL